MVAVTAVLTPFTTQVLLDAKMTLDEALQLRYAAYSTFFSTIILVTSLKGSRLLR